MQELLLFKLLLKHLILTFSKISYDSSVLRSLHTLIQVKDLKQNKPFR
jgi:hypothetical protein